MGRAWSGKLGKKGADYEVLQRFQLPMNIISGTEVGMVISTDSYYKGAMK